jgi:hypothetical protein
VARSVGLQLMLSFYRQCGVFIEGKILERRMISNDGSIVFKAEDVGCNVLIRYNYEPS